MSNRLLLLCMFLAMLSLNREMAKADDSSPPDFSQVGKAFLEKHCLRCHGTDDPQAEISLAGFRDNASLLPGRKVWDNVLKMVRSGQMPPEDEPQPTVAERESFQKHVQAIFDHVDQNAKPDPGRVTMRRLNRNEYRNTVRDLLGVDFDPTEIFPSDDIGYGFDNIGDVLTLSPLLMERYLAASEQIVKRVIIVNPPKPSSRYLSGKYLRPNNAQTSQGRFRLMDPENPDKVHSGPYTGAGSYFKFSADAEMFFRAKLYAEPRGDSPVMVALFIQGKELADPSSDADVEKLMGANLDALKPLKILKTFEVTARDAKKLQTLEVPVHNRGDIQNAGIAVIKPPEGEQPPKLFVEHLMTQGPMETRPASHLMLLKTAPDLNDAQKTDEVLSRLLPRAYRRPVTPEELDRVKAIAIAAQADGAKWEASIQTAIQAILCSPKFLFRMELEDRAVGVDAEPLDEYQLASRLAYFLWSSMPDETLFDLAANGKLKANLDDQVKRMLADPKADALVDNFALQWLQVKRLSTFAPDAEQFPQFNEPLRAAMLQETALFFGSIMREDRSILDLLDADYTFVNGPLAKHYGIADTNGTPSGQKAKKPGGKPIRGEAFVRVSLSEQPQRGGLLTQASILTVTSNPTRTSPVKRGKWVLEQILGTPPPPPPADVPELPTDEESTLSGSLRERFETHRANPSCANCHAKMDPLGFAFENYNAIGAYRTKDGEFEIDTAGVLPDGTEIADANSLKHVLKGMKTEIVNSLAEKLLTYAIGRGVEYYDRPTLEKISQATAEGDYKFSALVSAIVQSDAFLMRRGSTPVSQE